MLVSFALEEVCGSEGVSSVRCESELVLDARASSK